MTGVKSFITLGPACHGGWLCPGDLAPQEEESTDQVTITFLWRHDIRHNDTHDNDIQRNET
jgi:hypothetical protein